MNEELEEAQKYRTRAEELRSRADGAKDGVNGTMLRDTAATYDRLAHALETMARSRELLLQSTALVEA